MNCFLFCRETFCFNIFIINHSNKLVSITRARLGIQAQSLFLYYIATKLF